MRQARKGKVLCVGRTYCDLLFTGVPAFPSAGEEIYSENFAIHAGGGAYITAAHLAGFDIDTMLCSQLPTGAIGAEVMQQIERSGVDLSHCEFAPENDQPQITVVISSPDERSFLTNRRGPSAPASFTDALDDPALVHLHIAEMATLADNPDMAAAAKERGVSVSLDCSWDEKLLRDKGTAGLLQHVDIFLPNEKEIRTLLGIQNSLVARAAEVAALAPWVVVKQAAQGAMLFTECGQTSSRAVVSNLVDSTGAGDAFNAGFLCAWLNGLDDNACLAAGNNAGGLAVQAVGGASSVGMSLDSKKSDLYA